MRRILGSGLLLLALSLSTLPSSAVSATPTPRTTHANQRGAHAPALARRADQALTRARAVLSGHGGDATMALVALRAAYPHLSADGRRQADRLLARPTDGNADDYGDGYTVPEATPVCGVHVCIHYVATTGDAPDMTDATGPTPGVPDGIPDWVQTTLDQMEAVWTYEVDTRGFRAPASDEGAANNGGDAMFDVYLANVEAKGLYGYCAPEGPVGTGDTEKFRGYGFCVLDDDFVGFPTPPLGSLEVTAAHEFFHILQFNYDAFEDSWIMESTATWMEERYADDVNDNRFYLADSQMHQPGVPLDKFSQGAGGQYGNWIFFERLSAKYGVDVVRRLWQRMDTMIGPDDYSVAAIRAVLAEKGSTFRDFYASFAAGNLFPQKFYSEGGHYGPDKAPTSATYFLAPHARKVTGTSASLKHLTSRNYAFQPRTTMKGTWFLTVKVNGPNRPTGPAAEVLIVKKSGAIVTKPITLDSHGDGQVRVPFGVGTIKKITLTLANAASTYTGCYLQQTEWSCDGGVPIGTQTFGFSAVASR